MVVVYGFVVPGVEIHHLGWEVTLMGCDGAYGGIETGLGNEEEA